MKILRTFADPMPAQLLRARLEGSGIPACVLDENTAMLATYAIGGVKVEVADDDLDRASQFLAAESPVSPES